MPDNEIKLAVNSGVSKINISGIGDDELVIEYSGDIDVTELVDRLADAIDGGSAFVITPPPEEVDEKAALVLETIKNIVQKFNEVVVDSAASSEEASPP